MVAATAATDGTALLSSAQSSSRSHLGAVRRAGNVVHLPAPRRGRPSLIEGYTRPGWGGIIIVAPITDSRHPADEGAAELVVSERSDEGAELVAAAGRTGELLRLRLPASPAADIAALLAEAEEHLSAHTGRGHREHHQPLWERGVNGTWRAAVSDLMLLAVEIASEPAPGRGH